MKQKVLILSFFFLLVMTVQIFTINGISLQEKAQSSSATPITAEHAKIPTTSQLQQPIGIGKQSLQANSLASLQSGQTTFPFNYQNGNYTTHTYLSSSYGNPGQKISFNTTSTYVSQGQDWSMFGNYNNSYYYTLTSPVGTVVYNSTPVYLENKTQITNTTLTSANATGQAKINTYYNFSSTDFLTGVAFSTMANKTPTVVQINFTTTGRALGTIYYSTSTSTILSQHVSDRSYINGVHSLLIRNLLNNTKYYFIVNATDIFGTTLSDTNHGSFYNFTTQQITSTPYVRNLAVTVGSNGATITFNVVPKANATIHYGIYPALNQFTTNSSTVTTFFSFTLNLQSATPYIFDIILNKSTIDNNFNAHYNFTTGYAQPPSAFVTPGSLRASQLNNTMEQISFTTSIVVNASIFYGTSLSQVPSTQTAVIYDSKTFTFYISLDPTKPVTTYYYYIQLTTTTGATTNTVDLDNNNNNFGSPYYTFTTIPPAPTNTGFINITVQLPVFPEGLLGVWQFKLNVVKNITITNIKQPFIVLQYASTFILNDTLNYNIATTFMQRGTTFNGSSKNIVPNYLQGYPTTFSPGDSGLFIGQIHYVNVLSPVNFTTMPINGTVDVVFNNVVYPNVGYLYSLPATYVALNTSTTSGYNGISTNVMIKFTIPLASIYGNADIQLNLKFPGNQSYSSPGYIQKLQIPITVKYLLGITSTPSVHNYYYTQALNGSVTIVPYIYNSSFFTTYNYTKYNYSRVIPIPSNLLPVTVVQTGPTNQNETIAQVGSNNYTWSWLRSQIDFGISAGEHNITFAWSYGTHNIPLFTTVTTFTGTEAAYVYSYNISIAYGVNDLTKGLIIRPGTAVTLRFQIVVPQTNIPITGTNYASSLSFQVNSTSPLTLNTSTLNYNPITAEYSIQVNIASSATTGTYYIAITLAGKTITGNSNMLVTVNKNAINPTSGLTTTNPIQEKSLHLTSYAIIGLAVIGFAAYIGVIFLYIRRK